MRHVQKEHSATVCTAPVWEGASSGWPITKTKHAVTRNPYNHTLSLEQPPIPVARYAFANGSDRVDNPSATTTLTTTRRFSARCMQAID